MTIELERVQKRYKRDWIFKDVNLHFKAGTSYSITGPNGSGKSTLLQIIAGNILPTNGRIAYKVAEKTIPPEHFFRYISFAAPYIEFPEDFTLEEFLQFHFSFKQISKNFRIGDLPELFNLEGSKKKMLRNFSTGMKQRLKLGLSLTAATPVVLLDEPATNLDNHGLHWYRTEVVKHVEKKILIVSSNREDEYDFCDVNVNITDYKR